MKTLVEIQNEIKALQDKIEELKKIENNLILDAEIEEWADNFEIPFIGRKI